MPMITGGALNPAAQDSLFRHIHPGLRHFSSVEQSLQAHLADNHDRHVSANADQSFTNGLQSGRSCPKQYANPSDSVSVQAQSIDRPRSCPQPGLSSEVSPLTAEAGIASAESTKCHIHAAGTTFVGSAEILQNRCEHSAIRAESDPGQIRIKHAGGKGSNGGGSWETARADHETGWTPHGTAAISQPISIGSRAHVR